ncbi:DUF4358 domain-containing protein [Tissierella creatinophila]|uniref:DUF4358 domain-containing protein n=1 Tax=Tissierella creatinophila DSM 6911 TaxID=1123403 RepID=A0A1U7M4U3_TISCR|nr:DUF4358 domain-containing protein [Tissierella creatinophila]OLS02333.1 hypothetical protein TICRE_17200 [Tissierella creatinophila DSM 6911]
MKRKISILLVSVMAISFLIACTPKNNEVGNKDVDIKAIHAKVKEELGEDYLPDTSLSLEELSDLTKVDKENVEEFIAEVPMMNVHVDTFIAIKTKDGKGEEVEKTLEEYRQYLNEESMQYPMNIAKVKSAKVVRHGDYVFFIMIGKMNEIEDQESAEALEFSEAEVKRVENIINEFFK